MKAIFITILIYAFSTLTYAQSDIVGNYYNQSGYCLEIKKDTFRLIVRETSPLMRSSEIWAEGVWKKVNKDFIELNSLDTPWERVHKTMEVIQKKNQNEKDIEINFNIPYNRSDLRITIFTEEMGKYEYIYSKKNRRVKIPITKSISFYIVPENLIPHTPEGSFWGIIGFDSLIDYEINEEINYVEFNIPAIDDSFFEKYYIVGDYARIAKDGIVWKGILYKKR